MSAPNAPPPDLESGEIPSADATVGTSSLRRQRRRRRRRRQRPSAAASSETTTDGSFRFSDTEDESRIPGGSYEECRFSAEFDGISVAASRAKRHGSRRQSSALSDDEEVDVEEMVDLESGELELKVHNKSRGKRRECRICHLKSSAAASGGVHGGDQSFIQLGCCCKGDLGSAHKLCAETWFKIKGNTTCEICGTSAVNIAGEQTIEISIGTGLPATAPPAPVVFPDTRNYCHGRRLMNFLLACMVLAFIISWLFHFKILP